MNLGILTWYHNRSSWIRFAIASLNKLVSLTQLLCSTKEFSRFTFTFNTNSGINNTNEKYITNNNRNTNNNSIYNKKSKAEAHQVQYTSIFWTWQLIRMISYGTNFITDLEVFQANKTNSLPSTVFNIHKGNFLTIRWATRLFWSLSTSAETSQRQKIGRRQLRVAPPGVAALWCLGLQCIRKRKAVLHKNVMQIQH